jgi:hypothetical protein
MVAVCWLHPSGWRNGVDYRLSTKATIRLRWSESGRRPRTLDSH